MVLEKTPILIYDKSRCIGSVSIAVNDEIDVPIQVLKVNLGGNKLYILYVTGMGYGIIIPDEVAERISPDDNITEEPK
jgi:hypothetical protein